MMEASLLSIRLRLKDCPAAPPPEPVLRIGTTCVGALWACGCTCVGETFDRVAFVACALHREYMERDDVPRENVRADIRYAVTTRVDDSLDRRRRPVR